MKAAPKAQLRLLDLQALDTKLAQLAHRRANIPELAQLAEIAVLERGRRDRQVAFDTAVSDLSGAQAKAEADVAAVKVRMRRDQARLDGGNVSSARQLEDLQREVTSLQRRISDLEDAELEVMERLDEATTKLGEVRTELASLAETRAQLEAGRDRAFADVDAEVARVEAERARVRADLPDDLLEAYQRVARASGGLGAARLERGRCDGCQMQLSPADLGRIRAAAAAEVLRCEECRRILVRTPESGL